MYKDIRAVIFDHDDTLVGSKGPIWGHHKYVAKTYYGKDLRDEDIKQHWGKPFPELVGILYGTDNIEEAIANNTASRDAFPKLLFEYTIPTLQYLHDNGRLTGIVTAHSRLGFEYDIKLLRIPKEYIHYIQTADDTPYHKPDHRVFEPAVFWLAKRKVRPNQVLYVGDGLHDMLAAQGAGFYFVGVQTGLVSAKEFEKAGVLSVPTIAEMLPLIN